MFIGWGLVVKYQAGARFGAPPSMDGINAGHSETNAAAHRNPVILGSSPVGVLGKGLVASTGAFHCTPPSSLKKSSIAYQPSIMAWSIQKNNHGRIDSSHIEHSVQGFVKPTHQLGQ